MARKIKNPEKYIARLRNDIKRLQDRVADGSSRLVREINKSNPYKGECKADWKPGIIDEQTANSFSLGAFNPGDLIVVTGVVTEVHKEGSDSSLKFERKQTKLVQAIE